jgi:hypothetical protein
MKTVLVHTEGEHFCILFSILSMCSLYSRPALEHLALKVDPAWARALVLSRLQGYLFPRQLQMHLYFLCAAISTSIRTISRPRWLPISMPA